ncbi:hypothetical protein ACPCG0_11485 [Propionibacteriaceae bacterium Y1923]
MLTDAEVDALPQPIRDGLLGVRRPDGLRYPRFQVLVRNGDVTVPPSWSQLHQLLAPAGWSDENLLMWTLSPNAYLEGDSPAHEVQVHPDGATARLRWAVDEAIPRARKAPR